MLERPQNSNSRKVGLYSIRHEMFAFALKENCPKRASSVYNFDSQKMKSYKLEQLSYIQTKESTILSLTPLFYNKVHV